MFRVTRFLSGSPAKYLAHTWRSGKWAKGAPPREARVLLYLPEVAAAAGAGREVWVSEGEKDAKALRDAGVTATTNAFGAAVGADAPENWLPQYTEALRGARVVLVADRDPAVTKDGKLGYAGYRHVLYVAGQLAGVAESVRIVEAREGKDPHDHLVTHRLPLDAFVPRTADELRDLVQTAAATLTDAPTSTGTTTGKKTLGIPNARNLSSDAVEPAPIEDEPTEEGPAGEEGGRVYDFPNRRSAGDSEDRPGGTGGGGGGGDGGDGSGTGSGGGSGDEPEWARVEVFRQYEASDRGMFAVKFDRANRTKVATNLLPARVELRSRMVLDMGLIWEDAEGNEVEREADEAAFYDLDVTYRGKSHELRLLSKRRFDAGTWVHDLPWSLDFDNTQSGRSLLRNAITRTSGDVPLTRVYGALGWQKVDGRMAYIHAGGALDADGPVEGVRVKPDPVLSAFRLPTPPTTAAELREAIEASTTLLYAVHPRIAAPLLGAAYRACLGVSQTTVMPVGGPFGGKTGLGAYAVQHYAPGARHDNMPGAGAGEDAGTVTGLEDLRHLAGHILLPLDDLAPDKGPEKASQRCAQIARSQYNQTGKVRGKRELDGLRPVHKPRSLPLLTGEESTTIDSAETRLVLIKVEPGDVDTTNVLPALDEGDEPMRRARLTAALVTHYAPRMPMTEWLRETREALKHAMLDRSLTDPKVQSLDNRRSGSVADLAVGWQAMLTMAVERGALDQDEADALWSLAWSGLVECKRRLLAGSASRTPADRLRELLTAVLVLKRAALEAREGGYPVDPSRYGWDNQSYDGSWRQVGETVGWTDGEKVWLYPGAVYPVLARQADAQKEPLTVTKNALAEALADLGVIRTRVKDNMRRCSVSARVGGSKLDVWEFDHDWMFPPETEDSDSDPTAPTPPPLPGPGRPVRPAPLPPAGPARPPSGAAERPAERQTPSPVGSESVPPADVVEAPLAEAPPAVGTGGEVAAGGEGRAAPGRRWHSDPGPGHRFDGLGLVCEPDVAWLIRPGRETQPARLPIVGGGTTLAGVLDRAAALQLGHVLHKKGRRPPVDAGQVWITSALRKALGWPASMDDDATPARVRKVKKAITDAGWRLEYRNGKPCDVKFWMQVRRDGVVLDLVVPDWLAAPTEFREDQVTAEVLALRLGRYAHYAGVAFQWSPAVSGVQLVATTRPALIRNGRQEMPPPALVPELESRFGARRRPTGEERRHQYIHLFDFNGLYLGATRSLDLPWGEYVHLTRPAVDLKRPGYWKVRLPKWDDARLFDPFMVAGRKEGKAEVWVTTPTLKIAVELLKYDLEPIEAYLAAEFIGGEQRDKARPGDKGSKGWGRLLNEWSERLSGARADLLASTDADAAAVRTMVKLTYAHGYGRFDATNNRENSRHPLWRPDFRHMIQAQGRFSIFQKVLRAVDATNRYPLALIGTDGVVYTSDSPDPAEALPVGFSIGTGLGQVGHEAVAPLEPLLPMLDKGRPLEIQTDGDTKPRRLQLADAIRHFGGKL